MLEELVDPNFPAAKEMSHWAFLFPVDAAGATGQGCVHFNDVTDRGERAISKSRHGRTEDGCDGRISGGREMKWPGIIDEIHLCASLQGHGLQEGKFSGEICDAAASAGLGANLLADGMIIWTGDEVNLVFALGFLYKGRP